MRRVAVAAVVVLALSGCAGGQGGSYVACEAASLHVAQTTVSRGSTVTVQGRAMQDGCADSVSVDEQGNHVAHETELALDGIELQLLSGDASAVSLTRVDAEEDGTFTVDVTIPTDAELGAGQIAAHDTHAQPVEITVVP